VQSDTQNVLKPFLVETHSAVFLNNVGDILVSGLWIGLFQIK
jgi:hypothetical protein